MTEMQELLAASRAAEPFKTAVLEFCAKGNAELIGVHGHVPALKVKRLLKHVLATAPELSIERVSLRGSSGCSDFAGTVDLETLSGTHAFEFLWDCAWRAEEEGWTDYFGFPDQIRAAREFDWRCFKVWRRRAG